MSDDLKKLKALDAKLEWPVRILFTITMILFDLRLGYREDGTYVDVCLGLILVSVWCYFLKVRILSIVALVCILVMVRVHEPHW